MVDKFGNNTWHNFADVYAYWGEKDKAIIWLTLTLDHRDASLLEILIAQQYKS